MNRYAHMKDGIVVNVSVHDRETPWQIPDDVILLEEDSPVGPGWKLDGDKWIPAPPVVPAD